MRKKTWRSLISVMFAALLVLSLAACACAKQRSESGSDETAVPQEENETNMGDVPGEYEVIAMTAEGKETSAEDLALMKSNGLDCTITLNADGTGILNLFGEKTDLTWDADAVSAGGNRMPYTYQNDQLTITDGDSSLTFSKTE